MFRTHISKTTLLEVGITHGLSHTCAARCQMFGQTHQYYNIHINPEKALVIVRGYAGSSEPSYVTNVISISSKSHKLMFLITWRHNDT